jgi:hypothetical protein
MAGRTTKKGYLHWKKEDLQGAVESSKKSISLAMQDLISFGVQKRLNFAIRTFSSYEGC